MFGIYVHNPDVSEIGGFYLRGGESYATALKATEKKIVTRWAWATTVPGQAAAETALRNASWLDLGHRYNQYHGPNFITLWAKEFPKNNPPAKKRRGQCGSWLGSDLLPPNGAYSCGVFYSSAKFPAAAVLNTKWLAVWRIEGELAKEQCAKLKAEGWQKFGETDSATLWHTAESHSVRDSHGARQNY